MNLSELQFDVDLWASYNFEAHRNKDKVASTLGLSEEVGELSRAVLKQHQKIRGTYEEWQEEIAKELGDCIIKLAQIASVCGLSLGTVTQERWQTIKQRDWRKNPTGHGIATE